MAAPHDENSAFLAIVQDWTKHVYGLEFVLFGIFGHFANKFTLKSGRFQKKRVAIYFWCFCAAIASSIIGLELKAKGPNYYSKLNVTRDSSPLEIKRAYKTLFKSSPDLDAMYALIRAHDVLTDETLRRVYDKFGPDGVEKYEEYNKDKNRALEEYVLKKRAIYYANWFVLSFLFSWWARPCGYARWRILTGMGFVLFLDVMLVTAEGRVLPTWFFPWLTEHECVWSLHAIFPMYLSGCLYVGCYSYNLMKAEMSALNLTLHEQNKKILSVLGVVKGMVHDLRLRDGSGKKGHLREVKKE